MSAHPERRPGCPELLPCPCGAKAVESGEDGSMVIACSTSGCPWIVMADTREGARRAWNTRAPDPAAHAALEAERDAALALLCEVERVEREESPRYNEAGVRICRWCGDRNDHPLFGRTCTMVRIRAALAGKAVGE